MKDFLICWWDAFRNNPPFQTGPPISTLGYGLAALPLTGSDILAWWGAYIAPAHDGKIVSSWIAALVALVGLTAFAVALWGAVAIFAAINRFKRQFGFLPPVTAETAARR